jgi:hypothetical protein
MICRIGSMGTLLTFGELHHDEPPAHRSSNPMTNCSRINFIMWDLGAGKRGRACGLKTTDLSKARARSISEMVDIIRFQR